jgi:hypothetical protein
VDPARAIQLIKRELVLDYLKLKRHKKLAYALKCSERVEQKPKVSAPPFTVKG